MEKPSEQARRSLILYEFSKGLSASAIAKKFKGTICRSTVFQTIKDFKASGKIKRKPKTRMRPVRTASLVKRVREKIRRDPRRSMNKMAKDEGVSYPTMWRACRVDLGMTPYKKQRRQVLSEATKAKRLKRGRELLKILKDGTCPPVLWTDEKLFTVEAVHNVQNDRVLGTSKDALGINVLSHFRRQKPASVMVWAGVTTDGKKTPLIFIEEGVKVDTGVYMLMLDEEVVPWIEKEYSGAPVIFQQDGAPAHTSKLTQSFCDAVFPQFWDKNMWPPSSPDLNVMDFSIWSILERRACQKNLRCVDALKVALRSAWETISEEEVRAACGSTVKRLMAMVKAKGGHFEN